MVGMSYLHKHPKTGVYRIRRAIPEGARYAFGGKREYLKSMGTKNYKSAQSAAFPKLAELQQRIDKALLGALYETDEAVNFAAYKFIEWDGENGGQGFLPGDPSPYIFDDGAHFLDRLKEYCLETGKPADGMAFSELLNAIEADVDCLIEPQNKYLDPLRTTVLNSSYGRIWCLNI
jgi:hypothetical protein